MSSSRWCAARDGSAHRSGGMQASLLCASPHGWGSGVSQAGRDVYPGGGARCGTCGGLHGVHDFVGFFLDGGMTSILMWWWTWTTFVVGRVGCYRRVRGRGQCRSVSDWRVWSVVVDVVGCPWSVRQTVVLVKVCTGEVWWLDHGSAAPLIPLRCVSCRGGRVHQLHVGCCPFVLGALPAGPLCLILLF
jgi:hypothetical protein